jgi:hypothetical protein
MNLVSSHRLSTVKMFLAKGGLLRVPLKLLMPDPVPGRHLGKDGPRAIFLTGIHRSGTSWVGHVIAQADGISYWREPFNPSCGICKGQQYLYLTRETNDSYYKQFADSLFRGRFAGTSPDRVNPEQWYKSNASCFRTFIKDPTGAFLLDWLNYHYNVDVAILLRHPAAFVSSIRGLGWDFDFNVFLNQQQLMSDWLYPYTDLLEKHNYCGMSIEKASVLWGAVYTVLWGLICRDSYYWKRYEDICNNPIEEFKDIFVNLKIPWTSKIEHIITSTTEGNLTFSKVVDTYERDTEKMASIWKVRFSCKEIQAIRKIVDRFGLQIYSADW